MKYLIITQVNGNAHSYTFPSIELEFARIVFQDLCIYPNVTKCEFYYVDDAGELFLAISKEHINKSVANSQRVSDLINGRSN